ncbi:MAG: transposase [Treponema sp.]|jgi:transposase|nr:transposase [Treponema sp.]
MGCLECGARHNRDKNGAINLAKLGNNLPTRRGEVTSVDMAALALGSKGETAVETPAMGKSRNPWGASRATGTSPKPLPLGMG